MSRDQEKKLSKQAKDKKPLQVQVKNYSLTINNYSDDEYNDVKKVIDEQCTYGIVGKEVGSDGTPHLQIFLSFKQKRDFNKVKKMFPRAHIETSRKPSINNQTYCSKDGDFYENGKIPNTNQENGKKGGLSKFDNIIKYIDNTPDVSYDSLVRIFPEYCAKYPQYVRTLIDTVGQEPVDKVLLENPYVWQKQLLDELKAPASTRKIIWYFDKTGNNGKTYMSKHLVDCHKAFYCNGGKHADILYAYNKQKIVVFDFPRESAEYINYGVIEQLKNGILFSSKYESRIKRFNQPHVIIFSNFLPEKERMSLDRWDIRILNGSEKEPVLDDEKINKQLTIDLMRLALFDKKVLVKKIKKDL